MRKHPQFFTIGTLLLCFFCFMPLCVSGQKDNTTRIEFYLKKLSTIQKPADKLPIINTAIKEFKTLNDTSSIAGFYRERSVAFIDLSQLDSAREASLSALNLSREIKDTTAVGAAFKNLILIEGEDSRYKQAHLYADTAMALYEAKKDTIHMASVLNSRASIYQYQGALQQAEQSLLESLALSKESGNYINQARTYTNLGINVKDMGRYLDAARYLKKAEFLADSLLNKKPHGGYISIYNAFAMVYNEIGLLDLSVKYAEKCRNVSDSVSYRGGEVMFSNIMGEIFIKHEMNEMASEYTDHLLTYSSNRKLDPRKKASTYKQIGKYFAAEKDFDESKKWYLMSLDTFRSLDQKPKMAEVNQLLGELYSAHKQIDRAQEYIEESARLTKEVGDLRWPIIKYGGLGAILAKSEAYEDAIPLLLKAEKVTDSLSLRSELRKLYKDILNSYTKIGNTEKGLEYALKLAKLNQQLNSARVAMTIAEANASYKVDKLRSNLDETSMDLITEQAQRREEKIRTDQTNARNTLIITILLALLLVVGVITFLQRRFNRMQKEKNLQLQNQNIVLDDKNTHLELQTQVIEGQKIVLERNNIELGEELNLVKDELDLINLTQNKYIHLHNKMMIRPLSIYYIVPDTKNYIRIYTEEETEGIRERQTLSKILGQLPPDFFVQINKSCIINLRKIKQVGASDLLIKEKDWFKINPNYKDEFEHKYQKLLLK